MLDSQRNRSDREGFSTNSQRGRDDRGSFSANNQRGRNDRGGFPANSQRSRDNRGNLFPKQEFRFPQETVAEVLPENYVDVAEGNMRTLRDKNTPYITTSKIRNLFSLITDCYHLENLKKTEENLSPESSAALMNLRVRLVYEYARDNATKEFVKQTKLLEYLAGIQGNREMFLRFFHYIEALIAYHRYLGGKEG